MLVSLSDNLSHLDLSGNPVSLWLGCYVVVLFLLCCRSSVARILMYDVMRMDKIVLIFVAKVDTFVVQFATALKTVPFLVNYSLTLYFRSPTMCATCKRW